MKKLLAMVLVLFMFSANAVDLFGFTTTDKGISQCVKAPSFVTFENSAKLMSKKFNTKCEKMVHMKLEGIEYALIVCDNLFSAVITTDEMHCKITRDLMKDAVEVPNKDTYTKY